MRRGRNIMANKHKYWQKLFLVCLGIFAGTAFCMKWIEANFYSRGSLFTIIGLEISYSKNELVSIFSGLDETVRTTLQYHLVFDFAFMIGAYPGIASLCMIARRKSTNANLRQLLLVLACAQLIAFGCDIIENFFLLKWINEPGNINDLTFYHTVVITKWTLALAAAFIAIPVVLRKRKNI